ncbi:hypothetical protein N9059_00280 [bacterium]|nr:hypothetical protein [bacterium]
MNLVLLLAALLQFQPVSNDPTWVVVKTDVVTDEGQLSLHRLNSEGERGPAMFSDVGLVDGRLSLNPAVPLSRGGRYEVVLTDGSGAVLEAAKYHVPEAMVSKAPKVAAVYPSASELPANLLKFYLYFDQPMREGREIFDLVQVLKEDGQPVFAPWRRQELWSDDAKRLTLWVHPGRVKQGVNLRKEQGPVLSPGKSYTLQVSGKMRGANGLPLGEPFRLEFVASGEIHERINTKSWDIETPALGSLDPLMVRPTRELDHALLARHLEIRDPDGAKVEVAVVTGRKGNGWLMKPAKPWSEGRYRLLIGEYLEDLSGNTAARVFDTDLTLEEEDVRNVERVFVIVP